MPIKSQTSLLMVPELARLRAERKRLIHLPQSVMQTAFEMLQRQTSSLHARSRPFGRLYASLDPNKQKERRVLFYYLLGELENWDGATARALSMQPQASDEMAQSDVKARHTRNSQRAKKYRIQFSKTASTSKSHDTREHLDLFVASLRPLARYQYFSTSSPTAFRRFFLEYRLWVANEVAAGCDAMDDFLGYLVVNRNADHFWGHFGGDKALVSVLMSNGPYTEEEVTTAIVAGATRIGKTTNYRLDLLAVKRALWAWSAFKKNLGGPQWVKSRNRNRLNLHAFAQNLGL